MAGFVNVVTPREAAVESVAEKLGFPWPFKAAEKTLEEAFGLRAAAAVTNLSPYPPFSRSLRDGYAVNHKEALGAGEGTPLFLTLTGSVEMGQVPAFTVGAQQAAAIPTGGLMPEGTDSVVMIEDTEKTGSWVEITKAVQAGENVMLKGEELSSGSEVLKKGSLIDFRTVPLLTTAGITSLQTADLRINILSTGDEIVPASTEPLPPGCIRDVNGPAVAALVKNYGFPANYRGIVSDDKAEITERFEKELEASDVLILSGGSSVGVRDHCSRLLAQLSEPGLIIRGLNMIPGKPTLIAADKAAQKLVISLPGHPLSCMAVAFTVLLPLLLRLIGASEGFCGKKLRLPVAADLAAHTGPEEFIPFRVNEAGMALPLAAKSGYISVLSKADGFIVIPESRETLRAGEDAEVWLWQ